MGLYTGPPCLGVLDLYMSSCMHVFRQSCPYSFLQTAQQKRLPLATALPGRLAEQHGKTFSQGQQHLKHCLLIPYLSWPHAPWAPRVCGHWVATPAKATQPIFTCFEALIGTCIARCYQALNCIRC